MEKKLWSRPQTMVQGFEANEYIAGCGDTEYGVYKFVCDAPGGRLYIDGYRNGFKGYYSYDACGKPHNAPVSDVFVHGFVDYNEDGKEQDNETVMVWVETDKWGRLTDAHATTNINRDSWVATKS